jgi:GntR family transcriptional regulator
VDVATLSSTQGVPLYVQIREQLRKTIEEGTFQPGDQIPSEDEIAEGYGVSRMTARQGIMDLIEEGLLYRRHGVGTFVAQSRIDRDHTRLTNFFDDPKVQGRNPTSQIIDTAIIPAGTQVATALDIAEDDLVIKIESLRSIDDGPITLHISYHPLKLFPDLIDQDLAPQHMWQLIEGEYDYKIANALQKLEARTATPEQAAYLDIEEGAPILYKERVVFAQDGTRVELSVCYNRGDRYSVHVMLQR